MKHRKNIARIVAFALLAVTMVGTLTGCLSTSKLTQGEEFTHYYVSTENVDSDGYSIKYYAAFNDKVMQVYKVTEKNGIVALYQPLLGSRSNPNDRFTWSIQNISYTVKDDKITFFDVSTHMVNENKDYTGTYSEEKITLPGSMIESDVEVIDLEKTEDNFFARLDPNPVLKPGFYTECNESEDGTKYKRVLHVENDKTLQMYAVNEAKDGTILRMYPALNKTIVSQTGTQVIYEDIKYTAKHGVLTVGPTCYIYNDSKDTLFEGQYGDGKVLMPGSMMGIGTAFIEFTKSEETFLDNPVIVSPGYYTTDSWQQPDGRFYKAVLEVTDNTVQKYNVYENAEGKMLSFNPTLGITEEIHMSWLPGSPSFTNNDGVLTFSASSWAGEENSIHTIYYGSESILLVDGRGNFNTFKRIEGDFLKGKLPAQVKEGWYVNEISKSYGGITQFLQLDGGKFYTGRKTLNNGKTTINEHRGTYSCQNDGVIVFTVDGGETGLSYTGYFGDGGISIPGDLLFAGDSFGTLFKTDTPPDLSVPAN